VKRILNGRKTGRVVARPPFLHQGCVMSRNRALRCLGLCTPKNGRGACGRVAWHGLRGRTQLAIDHHRAAAAADGSRRS
jgi:hypothetical protein